MPNAIQIIFFAFMSSMLITFFAIPTLINIAEKKNLFDEPDERKKHKKKIPTLGGMAIFAGLIFSITFWTKFSIEPKIQYIITAITIMALIGMKDDIVGLSPFKKLMGQIFTAFVLVIWGDIRISSFFGIFGIYELPYIVSVLFTVFTMLVIINAFNLIDGIDGLSGSIALVTSLVFSTWFCMYNENSQMAVVGFAFAGSLIAFLRFNISPAKIFMGDTGSLLIGTILAVFAVEFIEINNTYRGDFFVNSAPVVAIGILILPLFDLLRVFSIRIYHKHSPLYPDRNHLHHLLVDMGMSHTPAMFILVILNIVIITISFVLQNIGIYLLGTIILLIMLIFTAILVNLKKKYDKKQIEYETNVFPNNN